MRTTLRGGIIGCGFFARHHIEAWRRIPDVRIVAACDADIARASTFSDHVYDRAEQMFAAEHLDFVDVVTRADSHAELVRLAIEHQVSVICQKPLAPDWETAVEIVRLAEARAVRLMVHENWRWQPWYRKAKDIIDAGEIGEPISYAFRSRRKDGRGENPYSQQPYFRQLPRFLIYEALIHYLDTARFLFGEISSVYAEARRKNRNIVGEDCATILVNHHDDLVGCIDGHRYLDPVPDGPAMGEAFLEGDRGYLLILATGDVLSKGALVWQNDVVAGYRGDSVWSTQNHFISCLRSGAEFESDGHDYLKTSAAMEAAYRSSAERRRVEIREFLGVSP
jgi:predicted dehydrogenase